MIDSPEGTFHLVHWHLGLAERERHWQALRLLEHGDFLGLFSTLMADYAKRFGLVTITHEGTFWDAEAGLAYMRTNRPARMIESFKSMVRAAVSA